jgi:hypothetical protein
MDTRQAFKKYSSDWQQTRNLYPMAKAKSFTKTKQWVGSGLSVDIIRPIPYHCRLDAWTLTGSWEGAFLVSSLFPI